MNHAKRARNAALESAIAMANVSHGDTHSRKDGTCKCYTVIREMNKLQHMQELLASYVGLSPFASDLLNAISAYFCQSLR